MLLSSSGWENALTALLPFVLLFAFWFVLMHRVRGKQPAEQEGLTDKLEEIRLELERMRKAIESRP